MRFRRNKTGQTIIELAFFVSFFSGFVVLAYLIFSMFNISQKQTMLLRNQAFMELGNFSDFGAGKQGQEAAKDSKSQVTFKLGKKSERTRVDISKSEAFKKAVDGDLRIDVTRSVKDDFFWDTYQIPKAKTTLLWLEGKNSKGLLEFSLEEQLMIAHNRSIDSAKSILAAATQKKTGAYSGSIQLDAYAVLVKEAQKMENREGLVDDLELVRQISKRLIRDDPSLSDEAAKLEKSLNAVDGLTGGAQAALISAAIQVALVSGLEAIKSAAPAAGGASGGAGAGGQAAAGGKNLFNSLTGNAFGSPTAVAQNVSGGQILAAPFKAALSPVTNAYQGLAGTMKGVSGLATSSGATWGNMTGAMTGLSQMGTSASFSAGLAGTSINELNIATAALAAPGAMTTGFSNLTSSLNNVNTSGTGDWIGVTRAVTQIVTPVTSLVSLTAPNLAVPMQYINTGLGFAGAIATGKEFIGNIGKGTYDLPRTLKEVGAFTTAAGALYSGVAGMTGKDPTIGAYISLGGTAMMGLGSGIEMYRDMKVKGFDFANPVETTKYVAKKNWDSFKESLTDFKKDMKESTQTINTSMSQMFGPKVKIDDKNAKDLMASIAKSDKETASTVDNFVKGVKSGSLSEGNLIKATANLKDMESSVVLNMKYQGKSETEIAEMKAKFQEVYKTVDHLKDFKEQKVVDGKVIELDRELLASGKQSADELNQMLGAYLKEKQDSFAPDQIKAIRGGTTQKVLEARAVAVGQTFEDQKELERVLLDQKGIAGFWFGAKTVTGGNRTLDAFDTQQRKALELSRLAKAEIIIDNKKAITKEAVAITQTAEGISLYGPIVSNSPKLTQDQAATLAIKLRLAKSDADFSQNMKDRMDAQIRKLELISSGQTEIMSQREWFDYARKDIDRSASELRRRQEELSNNLEALRCADGAC